MRVYFVNPPADGGIKQVREGRCMQRSGAWTALWTPVSLAYCAALARREGFDVRLTDCIAEEIDMDGLVRMVREYRPDLVILNAITASIKNDLSTADVIKSSVDERIRVGVIGIHGTALPETCFELSPGLDFVIRGEPEMTVYELALYLKDGSGVEKVDGISYRQEKSSPSMGEARVRVIHNKDRAWISDLDTLPYPAYDLIDRSRYTLPFTGKPFLLVTTSRGCHNSCNFCTDHTYYGKKIRTRDPERVADELAFYKENFGVEDFLFWAEGFTMNRPYAKEVARAIARRHLGVRWVCNGRVDDVDEDMIRIFKDAGCTMIGYGIESGVQEMLDRMNKKTTVEQIRRAVALAQKAGIEVVAHVILGYPGETEATAQRTIDFIKELKVDFAQFYCAVPFPGSQLYDESKRMGWLDSSDWRHFEQNYCVLNTPYLKAEEVVRLRKKAFREFYLSPRVILRTMRRLTSPAKAIRFLSMLKEFREWV